MEKYKEVLKSDKSIYRLANIKLEAKHRQIEFLKQYFRKDKITEKGLLAFYKDIISEYSILEDFPDVVIKKLNRKNSKNRFVNAFYLPRDKQIQIAKEIADRICNNHTNLFSSVRTLFHELRHFYQYKTCDSNKTSSVEEFSQDWINKTVNALRNSVIVADDLQMKRMIKVFSRYSPKLKDMFSSLSKEEFEQEIKELRFATYLHAFHEQDAREFAVSQFDEIAKSWLKETKDEKLRNLIIEAKKESSGVNEFNDYEEKYQKFKLAMQEVSFFDLGDLGEILELKMSKASRNIQASAEYKEMYYRALKILSEEWSIQELSDKFIQAIQMDFQVLANTLYLLIKNREELTFEMSKKIKENLYDVMLYSHLSDEMIFYIINYTGFLTDDDLENLSFALLENGGYKSLNETLRSYIFIKRIEGKTLNESDFISKIYQAIFAKIDFAFRRVVADKFVITNFDEISDILSFCREENLGVDSEELQQSIQKLEFILKSNRQECMSADYQSEKDI